jgi:hypothetical protein
MLQTAELTKLAQLHHTVNRQPSGVGGDHEGLGGYHRGFAR